MGEGPAGRGLQRVPKLFPAVWGVSNVAGKDRQPPTNQAVAQPISLGMVFFIIKKGGAYWYQRVRV